jgi:alanine-glyoxylate transaminase/serine-glyoxylate transaminase/serine-pyruvate transaminase
VTVHPRGRQFFHNPGPTNIPDRVLRAMDRASLDFMGAEFGVIEQECFERLKRIFKTRETMFVYAASGHGAWEAAMVNICSPGDRVLVPDTGYFSQSWASMVTALGVTPELLAGDRRKGVDPASVEARLKADTAREIKAVLLVHNETSTGVAHPCAEVRQAMDRAGHPALFLVDVISSLGSFDFRMDDWRVDVTVGGSQKGLMLPPGMSFTGVSAKALAATQSALLPRCYWDWRAMQARQPQKFPGTAPVNMFCGLLEALRLLEEEGLDRVFARHRRLAEATRRAVQVWGEGGGIEIFATDPRRRSDSVTAILLPSGSDAEALRATALNRFNVSLGGGLGDLKGRVFRIGHMGDLNEPMLLGALAAVEMSLGICKVPHRKGGVDAAMSHLAAAG